MCPNFGLLANSEPDAEPPPERQPVEVVGVGEAGAADGAVGEPVLGVDEEVSPQRAGGAEGPPTHRAHVALAAAHHGGVLWGRSRARQRSVSTDNSAAHPGVLVKTEHMM